MITIAITCIAFLWMEALPWLRAIPRTVTRRDSFSLTTKMTTSANYNRGRSLLIVDTDAGFDDLLAVQCLVKSASPIVITSVGGVLDSLRGAKTLQRLFPDTSVAVGKNAPVAPRDAEWLSTYRSSTLDKFLEAMKLPDSNQDRDQDNKPEDKDALKEVVERIDLCKDDNSIDILCAGPLTNLAHWLDFYENKQEAERFASRIQHIYIMGGNHPKLAHELAGKEPEFNFGLDPIAAERVLKCPILNKKIRLMTSSVSNMKTIQSSLGEPQIQDFIQSHKTGKPNGFFSTLVQFDSVAYSLSCDPVCAFAAESPDAVSWEAVSIKVLRPSGLLIHEDLQGSNEGCIHIATSVDLKKYLIWINQHVH